MKLLKLIVFIYVFVQNSAFAQPTILGTTYSGGEEFGLVFKTDIQGENYDVLHNFEGISGAYPAYTNLLEASNGLLYGLSSEGGLFGQGVLFSFDPIAMKYTKLIDFNGAENGSNPRGSLIVGQNGNLYGTTVFGGSNNLGVIFEYEISSNTLIKKIDFTGTNGSSSYGNLLLADNGSLYGMTYQGGSFNAGVLFEFNASKDSFFVKFEFDGSNNGRNPFGSLMQAKNGRIYGMTYQGGSTNNGLIFEYNYVNNQFQISMDFDGQNKGSNPYGSLIEGDSGVFYGMTFLGGLSNAGVIFSYDIKSDSFSKKLDFDGNGYGRNPYSSLLKAQNGNFYCSVFQGGDNNAGTIVEYNPVNDSCIKMIDFSGNNPGRNPFSGLIETSTGQFFGMTYRSGSNNSGIIYEFFPSTKSIVKHIDFNEAVDGKNPFGNLASFQYGQVYGLTFAGGEYNMGVLYEVDIENNSYKKHFDFDGNSIGKHPFGSLMKASNNKLYGMCSQGGSNNYGTIFEYDVEQKTASKKIDFDGNNGSSPYCNLVEFDTFFLYGMTPFGGPNDYGTIFKYNTIDSTLSTVFEFNDSNSGYEPYGSLFLADNQKFYSCTNQGGLYGFGTLFEFDPKGLAFKNLWDFDGISSGSYPQSTMVQNSNGSLFGMTQYGGANNSGTIFEYNLILDTLFNRFDFDSAAGQHPVGSLMLSSTNDILAMTQKGGTHGSGVIFSFNPNTYDYTKKLDFYSSIGYSPFGGLVEVCLPKRSQVALTVCDSFVSPSGRFTFKSDGDYMDTIASFQGCDSIISFNLKFNYSNEVFIVETACSSYLAPDGKTYDSSGHYIAKLTNFHGCDSVVNIDLTIQNTYSKIVASACETYLAADGKVLDSSGNYQIVIPNHLNCDSIIQIELTINRSYYEYDTTVCFSYQSDGNTYLESGQYFDTLLNHLGCDSFITINLTVNKVDISVELDQNRLTANANNASYQWIDCGNNNLPILNETNKVFDVQVNGDYAVIVTQNSCVDTSECLFVKKISISENEMKQVSIYPNPFTSQFVVEFGKEIKNIRIEILDLSGKSVAIIETENKHTLAVDIDIESGVYFIYVEYDSKLEIFKLIKN